MNSLFHKRVPVYTCPHCMGQTTDPIVDYDIHYCPNDECVGELPPPVYRDAEYVTIAVYEVSRQYGGPEEGGWWYDAGDLVAGTQRSFLVEDAPQAIVYQATLLHRYRADDNVRYRDQPNFHVRVWHDEEAPKGFPSRRPQYC